jgi:choline dehydrogenase
MKSTDMILRGTKGWYQAIADITGDDAYQWDNMFPFMKKSFSFTPPDFEYRAANATPNYTLSTFDTPGGPVQLSYPKYAQPISSHAVAGYEAAGFDAADGFLNGNLLGYGYWPFTIRQEDSTRSSAEVAFLSRAAARTSLKIYQSCMARNLIFNKNKRATGVNVTAGGLKPFTLHARKEVIVSSGFIHSPQLLMVSGIGPRQMLEQYNITVISDLSGVGQNLRDTPSVGSLVHTTDVPDKSSFEKDAASFEVAMEQYLTNGSGPLSSAAGDFGGWEKFHDSYTTNLSQPTKDFLASLPSDWPNMEYVMTGASASLSDTSSDSGDYAAIGMLMTSTTSKGNITLASADNTVAPLLHINWLESAEDQELAVLAVKRARSIAAGIPALGREVSPGSNITTDAQILNWIQTKGVGAIHHGAATCAMGRNASSGAVVDSQARVFGVKGLRVIDTSSLPFSAPGHTQGVTYAHAEKLAMDVINAARGEES